MTATLRKIGPGALALLLVGAVLLPLLWGTFVHAQGGTDPFDSPDERGTDPYDSPEQRGTDPYDEPERDPILGPGPQNPSTLGPQNSSTPGPQNPSTPGPQNPSSGGKGGVTNPLNFDSIQAFFAKLLEFLVMLAVPFIIFMIIYTGYKFVIAQGNPEALSEARRMFLYTIIGGLLILGASIVAQIIKGTVDGIRAMDHVLQLASPLFNF